MADGQVSVAEAGRMGGLSRARRLSPEQKIAIARESGKARATKKLYGVSDGEVRRRIVDRIRQEDPDLAWWVATALKAPRHIAPTLINLLSDHAFVTAETAVEEVLGEVLKGRQA